MIIHSLEVLLPLFGTSLFFHVQVSQEAGQVVWYSHLFKNFPQFVVIHMVKGFGIVNKAEVDVFLELFCFFSDPMDVAKSEELKSLLMKVKEESKKVGLELNIQKPNIMASSPITSWQITGETMETVAEFILGCSKITADGDCSCKINKTLAPWKKSYN